LHMAQVMSLTLKETRKCLVELVTVNFWLAVTLQFPIQICFSDRLPCTVFSISLSVFILEVGEPACHRPILHSKVVIRTHTQWTDCSTRTTKLVGTRS